MRVESSVTSLSWIPRESIEGIPSVPFSLGITHYDTPPPDQLDNLGALAARDGFRFANELRGWLELQDGRIAGYGQTGGGHLGSTTVRFGPTSLAFAAIALPDQRAEPEVGDTWVRFRQLAGGRTGLAAPRRIAHAPYVRVSAPLAWTSLALTLHTDGRSEHELVSASPFPRHWIYDGNGRLVQKTGLVRFAEWYEEAFGAFTPWGHEDSAALVTNVESALERVLSTQIMSIANLQTVTLAAGAALVKQGAPGQALFLLLDGLLSVEVDGEPVAQLGPGAIAGEVALLGDGKRTASLRAITRCRVVVTNADEVARSALAELANTRRQPDRRSAR
ncbi:MAG: cyclic nucleotide-binding domain-containing protein [Chloroflexota bacterium]